MPPTVPPPPPPASLPVLADVDVAVIGGGPGGLGAALFAARAGARVALVERYGQPGGMAVHGEVQPFMASHVHGQALDRPVYGEWVERMAHYTRRPPAMAESGPGRSPGAAATIDKTAAALAAEDLLLDAGVDLLYHHTLTGAVRDGRRVDYAVVHSKSGPGAVRARCFVDATGDGDLAALAGNACEFGDADGLAQPMTLCFKLEGVRPPGDEVWEQWKSPFRARVDRLFREALDRGELDIPRRGILMFETDDPTVIHFNTTRILRRSGVDGRDLAAAEIEGRRQMRALVDWLRTRVDEFKDARFRSMAAQIGVRESRRVLGRAYATRAWFDEARKTPDAIARIHYGIDIHNPAGSGTEQVALAPDDWYEIPYGCVVARDLDNVTVGCRAISVDHALHSSARVMPPVISLGQAAGWAAAHAALRGVAPHALDGIDVRKGLAAMGAFL